MGVVRFFRDNRIIVPVVIDNKPVTALLDTGADIVLVSEGLARELGRSSEAAIVVATTSGATTAPLLRDVNVKQGNVRLHAITVAVVNLATPSLTLGRKIDLVLGRLDRLLSKRFSRVRLATHSFRGRAPRRRSCTSPLVAARAVSPAGRRLPASMNSFDQV